MPIPPTPAGRSLHQVLVPLLLARKIAREVRVPVASSQPSAAATAPAMARRRTYASASLPEHLQTLNDIHLASRIIGYLDPASRLQFKLAAKCTFNAAERVMGLYMTKLEKLEPAQRTKMFNELLARRQFHVPETHALIALGEGKGEIEALRTSYASRPATEKNKPFVHWCIDRAIKRGSARVIDLALCLPEADVNAVHKETALDHYTPLHALAHYDGAGHRAIVGEIAASLLAHSESKINMPGNIVGEGWTPLQYAVTRRNLALIQELAKHPALDWRFAAAPDNATVLHLAARDPVGSDRLDSLLPYMRKLDINARDRYGNTPLHIAVIYRNAGCVRLLIDAGADQTIPDNKGRTPYDTALACKENDVLLLLKKPAPAPTAATPGSWQAVLGVSRDACEYEVVRSAYVKLARATHPDKGGTAEAFLAIQKAWEQAEPLLKKR